MKKVVVYDFDKTLTYKDTLFGFFRHAARKDGLYPVRLVLYTGAMVLAKIGLLGNTGLKRIGIALFLQGMEHQELQRMAKSYQDKIVFNDIYRTIECTENTECFIVSASFAEYLDGLFDQRVQIIGSELAYDTHQKVCGLARNCYQEAKVEALRARGVEKIDILYTDSYSDVAMAKMASDIRIVRGDRVIYCANTESFERFFKQ